MKLVDDSEPRLLEYRVALFIDHPAHSGLVALLIMKFDSHESIKIDFFDTVAPLEVSRWLAIGEKLIHLVSSLRLSKLSLLTL
jgi:hypothetical protein